MQVEISEGMLLENIFQPSKFDIQVDTPAVYIDILALYNDI